MIKKLLGFLFCIIARCSSELIQTKPNIILTVSDDVGMADHNLYNDNSDIKLNKLKPLIEKDGTIFTNMHTSPVCSPTRSSLMTGLFPFRMGMQHSETLLPGSTAHIPLKIPMIPEILKDNGYSTDMVGKWHMGYSSFNYTPCFRGFDNFYGYLQGQQDYIEKTTSIYLNGYDFWEDSQVVIANTTHSHILYKNKVKERIAILKDKQPFFLYYALQSIHLPIQPYGNYKLCENSYRKDYCNLMLDMEDQFMNLITTLKKNNVYNNSIIIYLSDNGGMVNFQEEWPASFGENYPLRGSKTTLFEGGVRVTSFLLNGYNFIKNRIDGDKLSHVVDVYSLIMKLANVKQEMKTDGMDLWTDDKNREVLPINIIDRGLSYSSIIYRDYKLIVGLPYLFEESDGWWFNNTHELPQDNKLRNNYLFNIKNDPYERVLLDHRENKLLIIKMKRMIRSYIEDQYMEPQKNLINIQALPSRHDGVWYPFEE